jgi:phage I-like protein
MPTGKFTHGGKPFTVTAADLAAFAADLNSRDVAIDFDHSFYEGRGSLAAGWFVKGSAKVEGDRLMVDVKWTPEAAADIATGKYRFISPEFSFKTKNQTTGKLEDGHQMHAAGLTNRPFFTQLAPLVEDDTLHMAASDDGIQTLLGTKPESDEETTAGAAGPNDKESTMKGLAEVYGLKADASEDEILEAARAAVSKTTELEGKVDELSKATTVTPDTLAQLTASAKRGEEAATKLHELEKDTAIAAAVSAGKILPTQTKAYGALFDADPEGTKADLEQMAANAFPVTPQGSGGDIDVDGAKVERIATKINGSKYVADDDSAKADALTRKILADAGKLTYTEEEYLAAADRAMTQLGISHAGR